MCLTDLVNGLRQTNKQKEKKERNKTLPFSVLAMVPKSYDVKSLPFDKCVFSTLSENVC